MLNLFKNPFSETKEECPTEIIDKNEFDIVNLNNITSICCHTAKPYICLVENFEEFLILDYQTKKCIMQQTLSVMKKSKNKEVYKLKINNVSFFDFETILYLNESENWISEINANRHCIKNYLILYIDVFLAFYDYEHDKIEKVKIDF